MQEKVHYAGATDHEIGTMFVRHEREKIRPRALGHREAGGRTQHR
jgi:hypothetical protein